MRLYLRQLLFLSAFVLALGYLSACDGGASVEEHLRQGVEFQKQGKLRSAVIEFKNALQKEPSNGDARWRLGETYVLLGDGAAAQKELEYASKYGIRGADIDMALVQALLLQRDFSGALERLREESPAWDPVDALVFRGAAQLGLGKAERADIDFRQALDIDAENGKAFRGLANVALVREDFDEARRQLERALQVSEQDIQAWLLLGALESYKGDYDASAKAYRAAIGIHESSLAARLGLAEALIRKGSFDEANEELDEVAANLPKGHPIPNYLRALAAVQRGNLVHARQLLGEVLAYNADYLQALYLMSTIHFRSQEYAQALDLAKRFVSLAPNNVDGRRLLAGIHLRLREYGRAISLLEEATGLAQNEPSVWALLGDAYMQARRYEDAARAFEAAGRLAPDDTSIQAKLARGYLISGNPNKAVTVLESVLETNAEFYPARHILAATYMQRGDYDSVIKVADELRDRQPDNPMPYVYMGNAYSAINDTAKAREAYQKALGIDPDFALAKSQLAKLESQSGDSEAAREHFEGVLESASADPAALRAAAKALAERDLENGDIESARARFQAVLARIPNEPFALTALAELAAAEGRDREGIEYLERAREHNPDSLGPLLLLTSYYTRVGDADKAIDVGKDANKLAPNDPRTLLLLAAAQTAAGELDDAVATYEKLVALDPESIPSNIRLAQAAMAADKQPVARAALERILSLSPEHRQAKLLLGRLALIGGHSEEAVRIAGELKEKLPDSGAVYVLEGDALMAQGQPGQAAVAYSAALERIENGKITVKLYKALVRSGQKDKGREVLDQWLTKHPDDPSVLTATALLHYQDGRTDEAIARYEKALKANPRSIVALNNLAWLYHSSGDSRALDIAKRAYGLVPRDPDVLDTYGWLLVEANENERGIRILRQAVDLSPDAPTIRYHLAAALVKVDELDSAVRELRAAISSKKPFDERPQAMMLYGQLTGN